MTSLHVTAHYGQVETAQLLLEKGASIDQRALVRPEKFLFYIMLSSRL